MSKRVLLVNEFGGGLGHLNRLISIAERLSVTYEITISVQDIPSAAPLVSRRLGDRAVLMQSVKWSARTDIDVTQAPTYTFADVIDLFGFGEHATLAAAAGCWRKLVHEVKPDLVVADFAPTLRLAIKDIVPMVAVGNGYTVPPPDRMLPPIRPWQVDVPADSRAREGHILAAVNTVCAQNGGRAIDYAADLFSGDMTFVGTLREFDPYSAYRKVPVAWPFNVSPVSIGLPEGHRVGPDIFVYLPGSHPLLGSVITALNATSKRSLLYIAGTDPKSIARQCATHVQVSRIPVNLADVLPQVRLLVHHGGLGTAYAGLAAGTPQLVLPLNLEHLITSRALIAAGVAQGFNNPPPDALTLSRTMKELLHDPSWMTCALDRAFEVAQARDPDPLAAVAGACELQLSA